VTLSFGAAVSVISGRAGAIFGPARASVEYRRGPERAQMAAAGAVVPSRRRPRYTRPASDPAR
jgi:hypothetical protein